MTNKDIAVWAARWWLAQAEGHDMRIQGMPTQQADGFRERENAPETENSDRTREYWGQRLEETVSVPRGDLGLLYQVLKDLEWSQRLAGCQLGPNMGPTYSAACPRCWGIHPDQFDSKLFPARACGHSHECALVQMIRLLRSALGAIE